MTTIYYELGLIDGLIEGLSDGLNEALGLTDELIEGLSDGLIDALNEGEGLIEELIEGLIEADGLTDELIDGLIDGLNEGLNEPEGLIEALNEGLIEALNDGLIEGLSDGLSDGLIDALGDTDELTATPAVETIPLRTDFPTRIVSVPEVASARVIEKGALNITPLTSKYINPVTAIAAVLVAVIVMVIVPSIGVQRGTYSFVPPYLSAQIVVVPLSARLALENTAALFLSVIANVYVVAAIYKHYTSKI